MSGSSDPRDVSASAITASPHGEAATSAHDVQFYEDDAFLVDAVARFIGAGLGAGDAAVVIATPEHRVEMEARLRANGLDVAQAIQRGDYVALDARATVSRLMVDGLPDAGRFASEVASLLRQAAGAQRRPVRAFGEMVALLWADGWRDAALRLEALWNELAAELPFALLCAYPVSAFARDADAAPFLEVCGAHSQVIPAESFATLSGADRRQRAIAGLQQKAWALETEVAHRRSAEDAMRDTKQTLRALVETSPLAIVVLDPDDTVRLWNPAAERLFGWAEDEVIGRPMPTASAARCDEWARVHATVATGEAVTAVETDRVRRDGSRVDVLLSAAPLRDRGGSLRGIVVTFEDVTERNRMASGRRKAIDELTTLYDLGRVLSAELDVQRLLQIVTDAATQHSGARFGAFFYNAIDDQGGHHQLFTLSGAPREAFERFGMPRNTPIFSPTFAGEGVVRLDDVHADPRYGRNPPHQGMPAGHLPVTSYLAVPVVGPSGEVFGGIVLGHPDRGVFTGDDERVVVGLAGHAAVAIEKSRLYDAERRARGDAEASNRAKDEFLGMLGYELSNPLSTVRNAVVTASLDPARRERALDVARRGADQLQRLVDDLLDVARITQGRIALRRAWTSLARIVDRGVDAVRPLLEERAHTLTVTPPPNGVQVNGDATRLEQVVANLVSNAAKYTDAGGHIAVTAEYADGTAVVRVRDDGMGIAPEMLPRVFDLFSQADRAFDRAQGGLGIGLTVVKRLVELHGGGVEAHSEGIGQGAELVVRLPAMLSTHEGATADATAHASSRAGTRILVVENNADAAESLMMLLELLGHRVRVVADGPAALAAVAADVPDVMLVDIGLSGMDGCELARRLRAEARFARVVLVALTGHGRDEDRRRALAAGFDHHLVKPVNPDVLQGLVAQLPAPGGAAIHKARHGLTAAAGIR